MGNFHLSRPMQPGIMDNMPPLPVPLPPDASVMPLGTVDSSYFGSGTSRGSYGTTLYITPPPIPPRHAPSLTPVDISHVIGQASSAAIVQEGALPFLGPSVPVLGMRGPGSASTHPPHQPHLPTSPRGGGSGRHRRSTFAIPQGDAAHSSLAKDSNGTLTCASDNVVIAGDYDHMGLVLQVLGSEFAIVSPQCVPDLQLDPARQTVFVNCAEEFMRPAAHRLEEFVRAGGQLITSDAALETVIEVAFPGVLESAGSTHGDECVAVEVGNEGDDSLLTGFFDNMATPLWWIADHSVLFRVLDPTVVTPLLTSRALKVRWGEDAIFVKFGWGEGTVYHMISHFFLQRAETRHPPAPMLTALTSPVRASHV
eukprot:TRINITY_DN2067_c0_g2_i3.p1 TRINITY_DN2067_c0_g2~~TRINITY_DN2067_c0_g2_i3.p1  ORF type:complete len:368 (+),score=47.16 TRINITY_DN2067_c0_g2_i3:1437-2540(+)